MKLNGYYATQRNLFFIFSRCSLYIEVIDGQSFTKQRRIVRLTAFPSRHTTSFQRLYYVYMTSATSYRRLLDIEKTSCVYWVAFEREWKKDTWKSQVKTYSGKCSAWYMKIIWKLQYQFPDAQINWLMGYHNSPAFIRYCTFDIFILKKHQIFSSLLF